MSVPTRRTSRSPFSRRPRRSAAVPGAPEAVTTTVIGEAHARDRRRSARWGSSPTGGAFTPVRCGRPRAAAPAPFRPRASPASSRPSSRPGTPRSPGAEQLQPREGAAPELIVRASRAPVLVRVRAVPGRIEPRFLHDVDAAVRERLAHVLRVGVVPGDDRIEARVGGCIRIDGVQPDAVAELPQPRDRRAALARIEVVENRLRHQEVRRCRARVMFELSHAQRCIEREVDVVAEDDRAVGGGSLEGGEAIAAGGGGREDLAVVPEVEPAAHRSTSTVSSAAAASARSSAATFVSATAIT